jgi:hypothetical protein
MLAEKVETTKKVLAEKVGVRAEQRLMVEREACGKGSND